MAEVMKEFEHVGYVVVKGKRIPKMLKKGEEILYYRVRRVPIVSFERNGKVEIGVGVNPVDYEVLKALYGKYVKELPSGVEWICIETREVNIYIFVI